MKKRPLKDQVSVRLAGFRKSAESRPVLRLLGPRGAVTLLLGTALSVGGFAEVTDGMHFLVEKDLDAVRVVRQQKGDEKVLATLTDGFAANSVFKLSRALPEKYVSRELSLFDSRWIPREHMEEERGLFRTELARINNAIREEFFANAMPYGDIIHEKAKKYDVDPALVAAVVEAESRFHKSARSQVGARGLMQLMPKTGRWMGARDLYDPEQNVDAGVKYIKYLQKRFDGNLKKTIAAYNAGEGNVRRYDGVPPFRETQTYVRKVLRNYDKRNREFREYQAQQGGGSRDPESDGTLTVR